MIADDVMPFGPSNVAGIVVVVVLSVALVVDVDVVLLAAGIDGTTTHVSTMAAHATVAAHGKRSIPRIAFTLPPRWYARSRV
jgi:hypothetical protein